MYVECVEQPGQVAGRKSKPSNDHLNMAFIENCSKTDSQSSGLYKDLEI